MIPTTLIKVFSNKIITAQNRNSLRSATFFLKIVVENL